MFYWFQTMSVHMKQSLTTTERRQIFTDMIVKLLETSSDFIIRQPRKREFLASKVQQDGTNTLIFQYSKFTFCLLTKEAKWSWSDMGPVFRKWTRCMEAVHTHLFLIERWYADIFKGLNQNSPIFYKNIEIFALLRSFSALKFESFLVNVWYLLLNERL